MLLERIRVTNQEDQPPCILQLAVSENVLDRDVGAQMMWPVDLKPDFVLRPCEIEVIAAYSVLLHELVAGAVEYVRGAILWVGSALQSVGVDVAVDDRCDHGF